MRLFNLFFIFLISATIYGQSKLTIAQVDSLPNTMENQFIKIYRKSNNWQDYKIIKRPVFLNFQKKVSDSIGILRKDILVKQQKIDNQSTTISSLNEQISKLNTNLTSSLEKKDSISLFGMQIDKTTYNSVLWSIISLLLVGLIFFIFKFKKSNAVTKEKTADLLEIEEEFEQFRKKTLEKEQKLRRQLHDEINKNR